MSADATVAVISPMSPDYDDVPCLFIPIQPIHTLKERIKNELNRNLNASNSNDRIAFDAMIQHLQISELAKYPPEKPEISPNEIRQLTTLFENGKIQCNGIYIVARGYDPYLDSGITKLDNNRYALNWTN